MDEQTRQSLNQRLASAAGHIRGIERMVKEDAYCIDMIRQIQAVQAALNKVGQMLLDTHLRTCMTTAVRGDDMAERERMLQEVTAVFEMSTKLNFIVQKETNTMTSKTFNVPNISCGHCTHTIETEVGELAGVTRVKADQASKRVTVAWDAPATWEKIAAVLQEINYPPEGLIQIS
ncbi:MAG: metal-sensing transcriptional repressor [Anaerolineae bacterium]